MTDYGVLANLVATATSLAAAAGAIKLAFLKRSTWQPPEEAVSKGVSRLSGLVTMVGLALLYAFAQQIGITWLAALAVSGLAITLVALVVTIKTNIRHAYYYPVEKVEANRQLGGDKLTDEAQDIVDTKRQTPQQLFLDAQGDKDLVWTRDSQAAVGVRSTLSYIALIGAGACCLASAGMLVAIAAGEKAAADLTATAGSLANDSAPSQAH